MEKIVTKLMDMIIISMICAAVLAGVIFAVEYRNAPVEEHYEIQWAADTGITARQVAVKDMTGTLSQEALENIQANLDVMLKRIDQALN